MIREELIKNIADLAEKGCNIRDILFFMSGYAPNVTLDEFTDAILHLRHEGYTI